MDFGTNGLFVNRFQENNNNIFQLFFTLVIGLLLYPNPLFSQSIPNDLPWSGSQCGGEQIILQNGIGALTCGVTEATSESDRWSFALMNFDNKLPSSRSEISNNVEVYHHPSWHIDTIGNVYGLTFNTNNGDILVTASTNYGAGFLRNDAVLRFGGLAGGTSNGSNDAVAGGAVYRFDNVTGQASVFALLPQQSTSYTSLDCESSDNLTRSNSGVGLGNIVFDRKNDQYFVSNIEDGRIYRLSNSGQILDSYDPFDNDDGSAGISDLEELVYGLAIHPITNDLYFGGVDLTSFSSSRYAAAGNPGIYSISLTSSGGFPGTINNSTLPSGALYDNYESTETFHTSIPTGSGFSYSGGYVYCISDLDFNQDGVMLASVRASCKQSFFTSYNHYAENNIITQNSGTGLYNESVTQLDISVTGAAGPEDTYGGVSFYSDLNGNDFIAVSSADILEESGPHGIAIFNDPPNTDGPITPLGAASYGLAGSDPKGVGGDIDVWTTCLSEFDLAITKKLSNSTTMPIVPGGSVTFDITVYNQGTLDATDIEVTDYIPTGLILNDSGWSNNGASGPSSSTQTISSLDAGDSTSITISFIVSSSFMGSTITNNVEITSAANAYNIADEDGAISTINGSSDDTSEVDTDNDYEDEYENAPGTSDNTSDIDDYDPEQITITHEFDLAIQKTLSSINSNPFRPGDLVSFDINIYNQGTLDASGIVITDYVPTGMTINDLEWSNNTSAGPISSTRTIGNLSAGSDTTVTIVMSINSDFEGTSITNNVEITSATNALGLEDEDGALSIIEGSSDDTSELDTNNDVDDEASGTPGTADNGSDADDYDPEQITIEQEFDLAIIKSTSPSTPGPYNPGDNVTFSITVYNQGTLDATGIVVTDYIPTGLILNDGAWSNDGASSGTSTRTVGDLESGSSTTVTISFMISETFQDTLITNNVEITSATNALGLEDEDGAISTIDGSSDDTSEVVTDNDVDDEASGTPGSSDNATDVDDYDPAQIGVLQNFDLALKKEISNSTPGPYIQGSMVTFDIWVYNQGTLDATGIVVTDYVPTGMTIVDSNWGGNGSSGPVSSTRNVGSLESGDSTMLTITIQVNDGFMGTTLTNNAEITAGTNSLGYEDEDGSLSSIDGSSNDTIELDTDNDYDDEASGTPGNADNTNDIDDYDPAQIIIGQEFDLAITKTLNSGSDSPIVPGSTVIFDVNVYNQGSLDASNVEVTDYIPSGLTLNDVNWSNNGASSGTSTRTISDISAGDSTTLTITFIVEENFMGTTITNNVEITGGSNALGLADEDGALSVVDGSSDDTSEMATNNDYNDEYANAPGNTDNSSDVDDYDPEQITVVHEFDLALRKTLNSATSGPFVPGSTVTFDVTVYNQGTLDAMDVEITDYVPAGLIINDNIWSNDGSAGPVTSTRSIGTLTAGDSISATITLMVAEGFMGTTLTNNAEITNASNVLGLEDEDGAISTIDGSSGDISEVQTNNDVNDEASGTPGTSDNGSDVDDYDPEQITIGQEFDLAITKTLSTSTTGPFVPGSEVVFDVTVYNQGTLDATGIVVTDYIPTGLILNDGAWSNDGATSGTSTRTIGDLESGSSTTVTIGLIISETFQDTLITNNVEITSATNALGLEDEDGAISTIDGSSDDISEVDTDNDIDDEANGTPGTSDNATDVDDYDPAQIGVLQNFDLALIKEISNSTPGPYIQGSMVTFDIWVYNQGTLDATEIVVTDYVPTGMTIVDSNWGSNGSSGPVSSTRNVGALESGDSTMLTITLQINNDFMGTTLTNNAEITSGTNLLGYEDEDGSLSSVDGSSDDTSELDTDNEYDDEASGTPGNADNTDDKDDYDPEQISLNQEFDLAIRKVLNSSTSGPFVPGSTVTFDLHVYNQGTLDATNIELTDYVPTGLILNDSNWSGDGSSGPFVSTRSIGNVGAGDSAIVTVTFMVANGFMNTSITNNVEITGATNALGLADEDGNLSTIDGSSDDTSEIVTNNNYDDEYANAPGSVDNGSDVDDYDPEQITIGQEFDLALRKTLNSATQGPFVPGSTVTFDVTVYNQGTLDATGIEVTEYIPTGLTLNDNSWSNDGMTGPGISTRTIGDLSSGSSTTVTVSFTVNDGFMGTTITNNSEITSASNALGLIDEDGAISMIDGSSDDMSEVGSNDDIDDEAAGTPGSADNDSDRDDYDPEQITIMQEFDLAITKTISSSSPGPHVPGSTVTFDVTVYNQGSLDATEIEITDYIPTGLILNDSDWSNNGASSGTSTRSIGDLAIGRDTTVSINFNISSTFQDTLITNNVEITQANNALGVEDEDGAIATVDGSSDDTSELATDNDIDDEASGTPGIADNDSDVDDYDPVQFRVVQEFDLALRKMLSSSTPGPFIPQSSVTFDLWVYNQGTIDATDVVITEYVPTGMSLNDANWSNNGSQGPITSTRNIGSIAAGDSLLTTVTLTVNNVFMGTMITNNAEISDASNALGYVDEDGDLSILDGSSDDTSELVTDDNIDDEATGTPGNADNVADKDDYDLSQIMIGQEFDLAVMKTLNSSTTTPIVPGGTVVFDIEVFNQGTLDASDIELTEYIPTGLILNDANWSNNGTSGPAISTYTINSLSARDSVTVSVAFLVSDDFMGTSIINNVEITAASNVLGELDEDNPLSVIQGFPDDNSELSTDNDYSDEFENAPGNTDNSNDVDDYDPAEIAITQEFDLALRKSLSTATPGPFYQGSSVTFDITVFNQGTLDATDIELSDYIPNGLTLDDTDWSTPTSDITTRTIGSLDASDSSTVSISFTIDHDFMDTLITNNVEITEANNALGLEDEDGAISTIDGNVDDTDELDTDDDYNDEAIGTPGNVDNSDDADDYDPAQIGVVQVFDLALTKTLNESSTAPFVPGDFITFDINVYNQGSLDASDIEITDYIPTGMILNDDQWSLDGYSGPATSTRTISNLEAGDSTTISVTMQVSNAFMGTSITNNAEITNATNALGYIDADSPLSTIDGSSDDTAEKDTDNEYSDDYVNAPGSTDNPSDIDDYDPEMVMITQNFDLALTKTEFTSGPYSPGDTVTFHITVHNQGTLDATDIIISDYPATDMMNIDPLWSNNTYSIASLSAGMSTTISVAMKISGQLCRHFNDQQC